MLLEQSQIQAEEKAAQEEEMRQNLSDLRRAQEESARREAEMTSILTAIDNSSLVIEIDIRGFIISANQAVLNLLSIPVSSIVDKHHREFVKPTDEKEYNQFWKDLKAGQNVKKTEHLVIGENDYWISIVYAPIMDDGGRVQKILSIGTDLTESKLLETELLEQAKYMAEQEEEMRQNLDDLQSAQREMSEKQIQLQQAHSKSAENEKTLERIVAELKSKEDELTKKNEQLLLREDELKQNIQKIEAAQQKYKEEHDKLTDLNEKLLQNETGLKEALNRSKEQEQLINQRNQQLLSGEEELRQNIEELQSTREQLQDQHEQLIRINEELAEKEAEIRDRFTALDKNSCIAEYLPDGTLMYANEKFLQTLNYRSDEVKGKHHRMFIEESERRKEIYAEFWNSLRNGESPEGEYRRIRKDNTFVYFKGVYKPLRHSEGDVYKVLEILTEITTQKQTEADLLSRIQTINLTNASIEILFDGTIEKVNRLFTELTSYQEEQLCGKNIETILSTQFSQSEAFDKFKIELRRGVPRPGIFTFISAEKKEIRMQGTFAPILDVEGHARKILFLGYDVTEKFT
jgi:methyl-accepting chemotaxis protein